LFIEVVTGAKTFYGRVRFKDGSLPRHIEPMFNVNAFAIVRAVVVGGAPTAYVNNDGDYILPNVPVWKPFTLQASIENGSEIVTIDPATLPGSLTIRLDFTIDNTPPAIQGIVGNSPAGGRLTANPGDTVKVSALAKDADGDTLQYRWLLPDGKSVFGAAASDTVSYTLPKRSGRYDFTAVVYDGKGGYAKEHLTINTAGVRFAGHVEATDAPVVGDAEVEIGGKTVKTDATGYFQLVVEERPRYEMNIRKAGYGLVSRIYDKGIIGGKWRLTRASVDMVNPMFKIEVVNRRIPSDCPGSLSERSKGPTVRDTRIHDKQDDQRNVIDQRRLKRGVTLGPLYPHHDLFRDVQATLDAILTDGSELVERKDQRPLQETAQVEQRRCGPGIQVTIPPQSLVDAKGNPPPPGSLVAVELTTVDLRAPDAMPGDYTARNKEGDVRVMESLGAGTVTIRDGTQQFNLQSGAMAEVIIPIDPAQLAATGPIPATIPLLSYDETRGVWIEEGVATRSGNTYKGQVTHFSAVNTDLLKVNQSCVRLETVLMPPEFELQVTVPSTTGGADTVKTLHIENSTQRFHVVYNLPNSVNIRLRAFEDGTTIPIEFLQPPPTPPTPELTVNTGGPQNPTDPNLPEFPYAACQTSVELSPGRLPPQTSDSFLAGLYSFHAANLNELDVLSPGSSGPILAASEIYYKTIDPFSLREDLDEFKAKNGFPVDEINVAYANSADLGFGRNMHCRKNGLDVVCYVTNYGDRFTDDLQDLIDAATNTVPIATVGMEYSRLEDPAGDGTTFLTNPDGSDLRVIKFYVYKEGVPSTATPPPDPPRGNGRAPSANLDGFGERPVPQLCMVCHGGRYPTGVIETTPGVPTWVSADPTTANLNAAFIPFDITGLTTPKSPQQQAKMKALNQDIVCATNPPPATVEVIKEMYRAPTDPASIAACNGGTSPNQNEFFHVAGWASTARATPTDPNEREVYARVVGVSCRMCHISQGPSDIAWDTAAGFTNYGASIGGNPDTSPPFPGIVCDAHKMPHSLVTHNRFWLSVGPHQPLLMHDFLNGANLPGTGIGSSCKQPVAP
jgi:hypothetical protein